MQSVRFSHRATVCMSAHVRMSVLGVCLQHVAPGFLPEGLAGCFVRVYFQIRLRHALSKCHFCGSPLYLEAHAVRLSTS